MKDAIHPAYFPKATVTCAGCNTNWTVGSTREKIQVELCSNCHPFYTGKQKLVDTAGRVERFRDRQQKAKGAAADKAGRPVKAEDQKVDQSNTPEETETPEARLAEMKKSLENKQDDAQ